MFARLRDSGIRLKMEKCQFCLSSLSYLGHVIDAEGTRPDPLKVKDIVNCPAPKDAQQLRSFLGMANYYGKFVQGMSTTAGALYKLTRKEEKFVYTNEQQSSFDALKSALTSDTVLVHYDPKKELGVAADASAYGLGAVLFHIEPGSTERPVYYASRVLSDAERNYSQVEKEGLAIVFALKRFQRYVEGRRFLLFNDHKPLLKIFGPRELTSNTTSARLQRWAVFLGSFDYEIRYKQSADHSNADGLSRCPSGQTESVDSDVARIQHGLLEDLPIDWRQVRTRSRSDPELSQAIRLTREGWSDECPSEILRPFWLRRHELTIQEDCLLWGSRVVIPKHFRRNLLDSLHEGHPGVVRMKALARHHLWWPKVDLDIEITARKCDGCQQKTHDPTSALLHPWEFPTRPWQRIHIDFAGPKYGYTWLVYVDAHSKYPGAIPLTTTTAAATCNALLKVFSHFGFPEQLVSDNGPPFDSADLSRFSVSHGIRHSRSSPYHPQSNGEAERFVQTFKNALESAKADSSNAKEYASEFLLRYRVTPQATTGASPAQLLMGRTPRITLDLLHPNLDRRVRELQVTEKARFDSRAADRQFSDAEPVFSRNFCGRQRWKAGIILRKTGPVSYDVQVGQGVEHRHASQLRKRHAHLPDRSEEEEVDRQVQLEFDEQLDRSTTEPNLEVTPVAIPQGVLEIPTLDPKTTLKANPDPKPVSAPEATPSTPVIPQSPVKRQLRDRGTLRPRSKFSDEFSGLGSKKK